MTKRKELEILAEAAARLGPDSYAGTWLREQLPFIEQDMRSDFPVGSAAMSLAEAKACVVAAQRLADTTIRDAKARAERILEQARDHAWEVRGQSLSQLAKQLREMASRVEAGQF